MKVHETLIEQGGVFRYCTATVPSEFKDGDVVDLGATGTCKHCNRVFVLTDPKDVKQTCYRNPTKPIRSPVE